MALSLQEDPASWFSIVTRETEESVSKTTFRNCRFNMRTGIFVDWPTWMRGRKEPTPPHSPGEFNKEEVLIFSLSLLSVGFGVDLLIEKVLGQQIEFPILLSDSVCSDKLELLQGKFIELVLHLPDC